MWKIPPCNFIRGSLRFIRCPESHPENILTLAAFQSKSNQNHSWHNTKPKDVAPKIRDFPASHVGFGVQCNFQKTRKITLKLQIDPFWENDIIQVNPYDSWPWCVFFCEKFGATGHESKEQDSKGRRANFLVSILMRKVSVISLIQCQCFQHIISHHIYNAMQLQYVSLSYQSCIINIIFETPTCCSFLFAFFQARFLRRKISSAQATLK